MRVKIRSLIAISLLIPFFDFASTGQDCQPLNATLFPHCTKYYKYTVGLKRNLTQQNFVIGDVFAYHLAKHTPNCSNAMELLMCAWAGLPGCVNGYPVLPCRKVCHQLFNKCGKNGEKDGLEWIINICSLLTDDPNMCIDLPEFTRDFKGPPQRSCYRLNVSLCRGAGYEHTLIHPAGQEHRGVLEMLQIELMNDSKICLGNDFVKRFVCSQYFPPCFEDEPHSYYTACRSQCDAIPAKCAAYLSKKYFPEDICSDLGTQVKKEGICKLTAWKNSYLWSTANSKIKGSKNRGSKNRPIPPEVIVAIVLAVVVTAVATLVAVLLWRKWSSRHSFIYQRYGLRPEENTDELEL